MGSALLIGFFCQLSEVFPRRVPALILLATISFRHSDQSTLSSTRMSIAALPRELISEATAPAKYTGPLPAATPRRHQGSVVAKAVFEYAE